MIIEEDISILESAQALGYDLDYYITPEYVVKLPYVQNDIKSLVEGYNVENIPPTIDVDELYDARVKTLEKTEKDIVEIDEAIQDIVDTGQAPSSMIDHLRNSRQSLFNTMNELRDKIAQSTGVKDEVKVQVQVEEKVEEVDILEEEEEEEMLEVNLSEDAVEIEGSGIEWDYSELDYDFEWNGVYEAEELSPMVRTAVTVGTGVIIAGVIIVDLIFNEMRKKEKYKAELKNNKKVVNALRKTEGEYLKRMIAATQLLKMKVLNKPAELTLTNSGTFRTTYTEYYGPYVLVFVEWCANNPGIILTSEELQSKCDLLSAQWRNLLRVQPMHIQVENTIKTIKTIPTTTLGWVTGVKQITKNLKTTKQYTFSNSVYAEYNKYLRDNEIYINGQIGIGPEYEKLYTVHY